MRCFRQSLFLSICLFVLFSGQLKAAGNPVGTVQFVMGQQAQVLHQGQVKALAAGSGLYVGDRLLTGPSSFIQVKMVDGALLSLRPQSELYVECYQVDLKAADLCMKFDLVKGQVRKVSGKAGKASPRDYRLNTPVAAIGIRGTDYVAKVGNGSSIVKVLEGAITVSPFVEGCVPESFGSCATSLSETLTESDSYMLQVFPGLEPQKIADISTLSLLSSPKAVAKSSSEGSEEQKSAEVSVAVEASSDVANEPEKEVQLPTLAILKGKDSLVSQFLQQASADESATLIDASQVASNDAVALLGGGFSAEEAGQSPLLFGTWTSYTVGLSAPYEVAKIDREVTVGGVGGALWRQQGVYAPPAGEYQYQLNESYAYVQNKGSVSAAEVVSGTMSVDFDAQKLNTSMTIQTEFSGDVAYNASHDLSRGDGVFSNATASGRVGAGAISNDGSHVGYTLSQPLEQGVLNANTLWGKQP